MEQNALYYPHIGLNNSILIKSMALYFDNIYRIVPENIVPQDCEELIPLVEEGSIGRCINPEKYSSDASREFLNNLQDWTAAALTHRDGEEDPIRRIHSGKIDEQVRTLFHEAGYKSEDEWMLVPTELASNFMLFLANQISKQNRLSLITSDWGAWTGTTYFGVNGQIEEFIIGMDEFGNDDSESFGLFGLIVNEIVPLNMAEIPADQILEFRKKRKDEIRLFRSCMHELRLELSTLESQQIIIDTIYDKAKELIRAQEQLKASADILKVKGWVGTTLMSFPAPLSFAHLFNIPMSSSIALSATD